ncbi:MAG: hypothetical protein ABI947_30095 [Chloroflexota bacterium]
MSKKPKQNFQKILSHEEKDQRQLLHHLREEIEELHQIALIEMGNAGVLPPFYAGDYLGEDRELLPIWAVDDSPELAGLFVRAVEGVEPNLELRVERDDLELDNDWPISEFLDLLVFNGQKMLQADDKLRALSVMLNLVGNQIDPAPGYDRETMIEFMAEMKPYAAFVKIPTTLDENNVLIYQWDDMEHYHAEIVYADSPQLLQAAVWEYRLNFALNVEIKEIMDDSGDPTEDLMGLDTAELGAIYETMVMCSFRLYGSTSPIRAKQLPLDILREENGDLVVRTPLKHDVEPIPLIAEYRDEIKIQKDLTEDYLLHLAADDDIMQKVWPHIRASPFYAIHVRYGRYIIGRNGNLKVSGYLPNPVFEWETGDTLSDLYRRARLTNIYQMLGSGGFVEAQPARSEI